MSEIGMEKPELRIPERAGWIRLKGKCIRPRAWRLTTTNCGIMSGYSIDMAIHHRLGNREDDRPIDANKL